MFCKYTIFWGNNEKMHGKTYFDENILRIQMNLTNEKKLSWKSSAWFFRKAFFQFIYGLLFASFSSET